MTELDGEHWGAEGFESGTKGKLAGENATDGTITYDSSWTGNAGKAAQLNYDGTGQILYANGVATDVAELYYRFYFAIDGTIPTLDTSAFYLVSILYNGAFNENMAFYVVTNGSGVIYRLYAVDSATTAAIAYTAYTPTSTPALVELHWKRDATTGGIEGRLDGVAWDVNDLDHDSATGNGDIGGWFAIGSPSDAPTIKFGASTVVHFDDLKINTTDWVGAFSIAHKRVIGL